MHALLNREAALAVGPRNGVRERERVAHRQVGVAAGVRRRVLPLTGHHLPVAGGDGDRPTVRAVALDAWDEATLTGAVEPLLNLALPALAVDVAMPIGEPGFATSRLVDNAPLGVVPLLLVIDRPTVAGARDGMDVLEHPEVADAVADAVPREAGIGRENTDAALRKSLKLRAEPVEDCPG